MQHSATARVVFARIRMKIPDGPQTTRAAPSESTGIPRKLFWEYWGHSGGRQNVAFPVRLEGFGGV